MWKWTKRILLGLFSAVALAVLVISAWGELLLSRKFQAEERKVLLSSRPDVIDEGQRLARVYGCFGGCHGNEMEGTVMAETPVLDRIIAPNLTHAVRDRSVTELEAIIRQGIKPDGTSVMIMPSHSFAVMSDRELAAILSFMRDFPQLDADWGEPRYGLLARYFLVTGFVPLVAEAVAGEPWSDPRREPARLGEYLALNACSECHGLDFSGTEDFAPSLAVVKAYDPEQFARLMREGMGLDERDLGLMKRVAEARFTHFTAAEMEALHGYLQSRF